MKTVVAAFLILGLGGSISTVVEHVPTEASTASLGRLGMTLSDFQ